MSVGGLSNQDLRRAIVSLRVTVSAQFTALESRTAALEMAKGLILKLPKDIEQLELTLADLREAERLADENGIVFPNQGYPALGQVEAVLERAKTYISKRPN